MADQGLMLRAREVCSEDDFWPFRALLRPRTPFPPCPALAMSFWVVGHPCSSVLNVPLGHASDPAIRDTPRRSVS